MWLVKDKNDEKDVCQLFLKCPIRTTGRWVCHPDTPDTYIGKIKECGFDIRWEHEPVEVDFIVKDKMNIKLSEEDRRQLERDTGKSIEELQRMYLHQKTKNI